MSVEGMNVLCCIEPVCLGVSLLAIGHDTRRPFICRKQLVDLKRV